MKIRTMFALAFAATTLALTPAAAQRSAGEDGNYWEVSRIDILPGQGEKYIDYLAQQWKKQQEWAKSKGYILSYHVLGNTHPRDGEADLTLITVFKEWPTSAESKRRQDEFVAMMKMDEHQMAAASGDRAVMRRQMGAQLYQEVILK